MVVIMEVCVDSVESAINAANGGAGRLELCSALSEGGLTPTPGFLEVVKSLVSIPVFVMLRPRTGIDFVYSSSEVEVMKRDAQLLKVAGADGFVFGALNESGRVNEDVCKQLFNVILPLPATFHRAFDAVLDPLEALETIMKLGFSRILTSGQEISAEKGVELIKTLISKSKDKVIIMPGAGISKNNLAHILSVTGTTEFHVSGRQPKQLYFDRSYVKCQMGTVDDSVMFITNEEIVREMLNIANNTIHPD